MCAVTLRDRNLGSFGTHIPPASADQPIQVPILYDIRVGNKDRTHTDMGELLDHMRPATTDTDDPDPRVGERDLAVKAEKALAVEPGTHYLNSVERNGAPISPISSMCVGSVFGASQQRPTAESRLRTTAACGNAGRTLKKSGMNLWFS